MDPVEFQRLRAQICAEPVEKHAALPVPDRARYLGIAELAQPDLLLEHSSVRSSPVPLYTGLQPSGNGFWSFGQTVYWALDDGQMGPAAYSTGGGHVTAIEFAFGLHGDFAGDQVQPYVIVAFYNAPTNPVAGATNPVVTPPAPVRVVDFLFSPVTLPGVGNYSMSSGLIDLIALNADFPLDKTFYVEVIPLEWDSIEGVAIPDPDVHATFTGPGTVTYGANQDRMWSDFFVFKPARTNSDHDGLYDHPAEMDLGGRGSQLDQTGINLVGMLCDPVNQLELRIDPQDECVSPGETIDVTLHQQCLPTLVRGYQAFLSFTPGLLGFTSGSYILPLPYGLPVITPITASGGSIDLAAGINNLGGQTPTAATADLAVLHFTAGLSDGPTQVKFRPHDPPTRFSDALGAPVVPALIDTPVICVDGTAPVITCPADPMPVCTNGVPSPATDLASFVMQGGSVVDGACGTVVVTYEGQTVTGSMSCPGGPRTYTRTYRATDCAGHTATCEETITLHDTVLPVLTIPASISVSSDAGTCSAAGINPGMATAIDSCGLTAVVSWARSDGKLSLTDPYDAIDSPISITWSATDCAGNVKSLDQTITVADTNEMVVDVSLDGMVNTSAFTRCITFELWKCPDTAPNAIVPAQLTFTDGVAGGVVNVPCGEYVCVTARDRLHTLRRTLASPSFIDTGTQYEADFVSAAKPLVGGNLNDDMFIDILDFGVLTAQYLSGLSGSTTCSTPAPHSNIDGDSVVDGGDFSFITANFLDVSEPNCCGAPALVAGGAPTGPRARISVRELRALGLADLAVADLDKDGEVDESDIAALLSGVRPEQPTRKGVTQVSAVGEMNLERN
jgi:hypothetical protein